jgi:2-hydroxychromene-2-carboxylate isomerase
MIQIDYFLNPISPFTYLAGDRLEQIAAKYGADITYKPFDLMAAFGRTGGKPLGERHASRQAYRLQELARIARRYQMPINLQPAHFPTNPAPASYAMIAAQSAGGGDVGALARALLRSCFVEEQNIAEDGVIRTCLSAAGFDPGLADRGLMEGAETYVRNTEEAVAQGVFGAPFYVVGEEKFWGQDRLSYLDDYLAGLA